MTDPQLDKLHRRMTAKRSAFAPDLPARTR